MDDSIKLSISTASGGLFEKQVSYVNLPTGFGSLGILRGHGPMLCAVGEGRVHFRFGEGQTGSVKVGEGVATVANNEVLLLVKELSE